MTGDSTLLSHKISMQTLRYDYLFHLELYGDPSCNSLIGCEKAL